MLRAIVALGAVAALTAWSPADAQPRWSAEVDAGVAVPTARLAGADLKSGFGLGANVRFRVQPHLSVYTGWEYHTFRSDALLGADEIDVDDTGYTFGLRFEHPLGGGSAGWVRAGGLANHIELENASGDNVGDSGHGLGFELGAGLTIPIGARLSLTPGVRYRSLSRDLQIGTASRGARLSYVLLGAGVSFDFR